MNKNKEQRKLLKQESYILRQISKTGVAQGQKLIHNQIRQHHIEK